MQKAKDFFRKNYNRSIHNLTPLQRQALIHTLISRYAFTPTQIAHLLAISRTTVYADYEQSKFLIHVRHSHFADLLQSLRSALSS